MAGEQLDLSEYNGAAMVGTSIAFLIMSWLAVGLRTYTRAVLTKNLQSDDWLMIISQLIFTASCAFVLAGVQRGLGRHNDAIKSDDDKIAALMWQALAAVTYLINMMFIKLSIGVFLLRVSVRKLYNYIIIVSMIVIAIWSLIIFFWDIFQCTPVQKQWDYRITEGSCFPPSAIIAAAYAMSAMTIVSDWLYALLPVPMLWSVKMTKQAKTTVILILGMGIFASIATIVRIRYLDQLQDSEDLLFSGTNVMVWTLIEPGVAIVASSLATIRPLLRALKIRGFASTGYTRSLPSGQVRHTGENRSTHLRTGASDADIERGSDFKLPETSTKNIGLTIELQQTHSPAEGANTRSHVKTEVYAADGKDRTGTWSSGDEASHTRNPSFDDSHSFEQRSQDSGRTGLKSGGFRG